MQNLVGKEVEVLALETTYKGRLIEIGETEVYLEAESGWIMIPGEKIISITEQEDQSA
ncbi:MAG: hypothetical protein QMD07_07290 [Thermodesulfovibrionales bacterium]|nr:hypothetical protein [Thermodesulfovibrionales bacterium]